MNKPWDLRALLYAAILLTVLLLLLSSGVIRYSPSPSLRYRLFVALPGSPRAGDYVAFCAPPEASARLLVHGYPTSSRCRHQAVELIKVVLSIDPEDRRAELRGHHRHSLDSRRFGEVPLADLTRLHPIW